MFFHIGLEKSRGFQRFLSFHEDHRAVICECPLFSSVFFGIPSDARNNTLSQRAGERTAGRFRTCIGSPCR